MIQFLGKAKVGNGLKPLLQLFMGSGNCVLEINPPYLESIPLLYSKGESYPPGQLKKEDKDKGKDKDKYKGKGKNKDK